MKTHMILLSLRVAVATDFTNVDGTPKWNAVYFIQSHYGPLQKKMNYLTPECNKESFKTLFSLDQIWVPVNPDEVLKTTINECKLEHLQDWKHLPKLPPFNGEAKKKAAKKVKQ